LGRVLFNYLETCANGFRVSLEESKSRAVRDAGSRGLGKLASYQGSYKDGSDAGNAKSEFGAGSWELSKERVELTCADQFPIPRTRQQRPPLFICDKLRGCTGGYGSAFASPKVACGALNEPAWKSQASTLKAFSPVVHPHPKTPRVAGGTLYKLSAENFLRCYPVSMYSV
jgi:hypothetical protein